LWRRALGKRATSAVPLLLCGLLLAVAVTAAVSLGEPRYRIPFDGILIALTAAVFAGVRIGFPPRWDPDLEQRTRRAVVGAGAGVAAMSALVISISHPAIAAGKAISSGVRARSSGEPTIVQAQNHARVRSAGSLWDQAGNHVFRCRPDCSELRLRFPAPQTPESVELSVDSNDRYLVAFYRDGTLLARTELPVRHVRGMRLERILVPAAASGFDSVGVLPLYGDGSYSFGHLVLR
jgi:hypothetical protein